MNHSLEMKQTIEKIKQNCGPFVPEIAIILGSGLGRLKEHLHEIAHFPYSALQILPKQKVVGHQAELLIGELFGRKVLLFCGRFHVYQGLSSFETTFPVQLAAGLGCHSVLLTCAVGGIAKEIKPGDFLLVKDHLNLSGLNPLQGVESPAFIDLHNCYQHEFIEHLKTEALSLKCALYPGILAYMPGPSYETPAEVSALRTLGASAVSMSTVPEAIMARALGLQVIALALVTNLAGGSAQEKLSHQGVLRCSAAAAEPFSHLIKTLLSKFIST